jgi:hypothetical protein
MKDINEPILLTVSLNELLMNAYIKAREILTQKEITLTQLFELGSYIRSLYFHGCLKVLSDKDKREIGEENLNNIRKLVLHEMQIFRHDLAQIDFKVPLTATY